MRQFTKAGDVRGFNKDSWIFVVFKTEAIQSIPFEKLILWNEQFFQSLYKRFIQF